jgi:HlyD family secretion protein
MKRILTFLLILVVVSLFGGTLYFLWAKSKKPQTIYATQSPTKSTIIKKAVATGSVLPRQEVEIKPQVSGIVDQLYLEPGDQVEKGTLIARIRLVPNMVTQSNAQSRLNRSKISLESAQRDFDRNLSLMKDGTISTSVFQGFETALKSAKEEVQAAQDNLDLVEKGVASRMGETSNTLVRSTIAGMVLEVPVKVGTSVIEANTFNAGTTLATVADMNDMIFDGTVDESEVGKLREGMALLLTVAAIDDRRLDATLEHIAPKGVSKDGAIQFQIKAAVKPSADVLIRANYSANADVVLDRRDEVLSLPESVLVFDGGKTYVEVETAPQTFERREIQTGLSDGITIEVVSGVGESDKVKAGEQKPGGGGPPARGR